MRFRHIRCATCALPFKVIQAERDNTVQVSRTAWEGLCPHAREAGEPRMCVHLRRAVHDADAASAV